MIGCLVAWFGGGRPGLALVALSVIEQRYQSGDGGAGRREVDARWRPRSGVSRQSVHAWVARYRAAGLAGLADRSRRPRSCPNQASAEVEAGVCELRRAHPRWGALRIVHELMRGPAPPEPLPSRATVHRILVRHGLVIARARRRKRVGLRALAAAGGDAAVAAGHRLRAAGWSTPSRASCARRGS